MSKCRSWSGRSTEDINAQVLLQEHQGYVASVFRRFGAPADVVEDLVQEVFLVFVRRFAEFRGESAVRTWLHAIATRVWSTWRRTEFRHRRRLQAQREVASHTAWSYGCELEDRVHLGQLLDALDPETAELVVMTRGYRMTAREVAAKSNLSPAAVYSRLRRLPTAVLEGSDSIGTAN